MTRKDNKGRVLRTGETYRTDGRYMYRYVDNRGKRRVVYANTLVALRDKEKSIAKDLEDNILCDSMIRKLTVNELFQRYMETKALSDTTRRNYIKMWNLHVKLDIGMIKVVNIRKSHIKEFYAKLSKAKYSYSTIKLLHNMISPTLEMAVEDDMIRRNPAKKALSIEYGNLPKRKQALSVEQQDKLLEFITSNSTYNIYEPLIRIMWETGMRCGELIGLTWADVDMNNKHINVNHQLIYKDFGDGYQFRCMPYTKTEAGEREIPLTQVAYNAFIEQRNNNSMLGRRCIEEIDGYTDFIFLTRNGRPLMPNGLNNVIYNIIDAYNKQEKNKANQEHRKAELIPKFSCHVNRHTACTNMARQGISPKYLQYIMGHAHVAITMEVYTHITSMADIKREIDKIDKDS